MITELRRKNSNEEKIKKKGTIMNEEEEYRRHLS